MRMQTTPGQRISTISGRHYTADETGLIEDVDPGDAGELTRVGCREAAEPLPVRATLELPAKPAAAPLEPAAAGHHEAPEQSA